MQKRDFLFFVLSCACVYVCAYGYSFDKILIMQDDRLLSYTRPLQKYCNGACGPTPTHAKALLYVPIFQANGCKDFNMGL
jgi:hypothetical protein